MELEVRHLRLVVAIAEHGSVSRAGAQLGLSQPAVSTQLRRLERMLDGRLFERDSHGARPTALGELVVRRARAMLPLMDELCAGLRHSDESADTPRLVRIGGMAGPLAGRLVGPLTELCEGAEVSLRAVGTSAQLIELLAESRLELAVVQDCPGHQLVVPPGLSVAAVVTEPVFVALPMGHRLAANKGIELAELAQERWVMPAGREDPFLDIVHRVCHSVGFVPRIGHLADSRAALELIADGQAIGLVPPIIEHVPGMVIRPLREPRLVRRQLVAWATAGPLRAEAGHLPRLAMAAYWKLAERTPGYRAWLARNDSALGQPNQLGARAS